MINKLIRVLKSGTSEGARKAVETKRATGVYPVEPQHTKHSFAANPFVGKVSSQKDASGNVTGVEARYTSRAILWPQDHRNYVISHTYKPGAEKPHEMYSRLTDLRGKTTTNPKDRHNPTETSTETRASFRTEAAAHRWLAARGIQKPHSVESIAGRLK